MYSANISVSLYKFSDLMALYGRSSTSIVEFIFFFFKRPLLYFYDRDKITSFLNR